MEGKTLYIKFVNGDVQVFVDGWTDAYYQGGYLIVVNDICTVLAAPSDKVNYYRVTEGV